MLGLDFALPSPQPRGAQPLALPSPPAEPAGRSRAPRGEPSGARSPGHPVALSPCPGRAVPSPRSLGHTHTHGHGCGGAGDPHRAALGPCPCVSPRCPLAVASLQAARDLPTAPSMGWGHARAPRPPQLRAWGHGHGHGWAGTDRASVLYSIKSCFLSGAHICPGVKKDKEKKKRQSSSSVSGCEKISVSYSSQAEAEARPGAGRGTLSFSSTAAPLTCSDSQVWLSSLDAGRSTLSTHPHPGAAHSPSHPHGHRGACQAPLIQHHPPRVSL